jgi:hypothetical protein
MITKKSVALEKFEEEFCTALKVKGKKIGSYSTDYWGMHDGNEGVQWNIWENKKSEIWLGVNLEGKEYNNWPIADFIINELREGKLISLARGIDYSSMIWVGMHRDAWGKNGIRELIEERKIGHGLVKLSDLNERNWEEMLQEAINCLNKKKNYRGRAIQNVTLMKSGIKKEGVVSPHLNIQTQLVKSIINFKSDAKKIIEDSITLLRPFYDFVNERVSGRSGS